MSVPVIQLDLYEILGVPRDATADQIKRAYRRAAKAAHPDAGGSPEAFTRVQQAYEILSDRARRERYDSTGETAPEEPGEIERIIMGAIDRAMGMPGNLVNNAAGLLDKDANSGRMANIKLVGERQKIEHTLKRLKFRGDGTDFVTANLMKRIEEINRYMESNNSIIVKVCDAAKKLHDGWVCEDPDVYATTHTSFFTFNVRD